MLQRASETLFSTTTLLWLFAAAAAAALLFGGMTGHRNRLTEALRDHVRRQQSPASEPESAESSEAE